MILFYTLACFNQEFKKIRASLIIDQFHGNIFSLLTEHFTQPDDHSTVIDFADRCANGWNCRGFYDESCTCQTAQGNNIN